MGANPPLRQGPADRAAVDVVFESLARAFAEHPPKDRAWIEDDYVARTGMLPAALRDRLLGGMFSEDPAAQVAAAGRLVAFEDSDPALTAEIPGNQLARARVIPPSPFPIPLRDYRFFFPLLPDSSPLPSSFPLPRRCLPAFGLGPSGSLSP